MEIHERTNQASLEDAEAGNASLPVTNNNNKTNMVVDVETPQDHQSQPHIAAVHHSYRRPLSTTKEGEISLGGFAGEGDEESTTIQESFELEEVSISRAESWRLGMPWFRNAVSPSILGGAGGGLMIFSSSSQDGNGNNNDDSSRSYYGGIMKSQGSYNAAEPATPRTQIQQSQQQQQQKSNAKFKKKRSRTTTTTKSSFPDNKNNNSRTTPNHSSEHPSFFRTLSNLSHFSRSGGSSVNGRDSIADFDDSEWTPQDSAYGAAFPIFGCIPKPVRRFIEFTMLTLLLVAFVYLVVATSIHITNERNAIMASQNTTESNNSNNGQIALEDDYYIEYHDDYYYNDDKVADDDMYYAGAACNGDDDDCYATYDNNANNDVNDDDDYYSSGNNDDNGSGGRRWFML